MSGSIFIECIKKIYKTKKEIQKLNYGLLLLPNRAVFYLVYFKYNWINSSGIFYSAIYRVKINLLQEARWHSATKALFVNIQSDNRLKKPVMILDCWGEGGVVAEIGICSLFSSRLPKKKKSPHAELRPSTYIAGQYWFFPGFCHQVWEKPGENHWWITACLL